jgi:hypothetical protein
MSFWTDRRFVWSLSSIVVLALALRIVWPLFFPPPTTATALSMTIQGGFAYINSPSDNKVSIAFMKSYSVDTPTNVCKVEQKGVDLLVDDGDILEPANWNNSTPFDPAGAVVTFAASYASNGDPRRPAGQPNPKDPMDGEADAQWRDSRFVPTVSTYFQGNPLNSNWPSLADGYLELTHGTLQGGKPTDVVVRHGDWQFKPTQTATAIFNQAMTDIAIYNTIFFGDTLTINLPGARAGVTKIRVKPSQGRPIHLVLMGKHAQGTPDSINPNDPIDHFCVFYQLMDPIPPKSTWLIPYFAGVVGGVGPNANGTPGAYCPGDAF